MDYDPELVRQRELFKQRALNAAKKNQQMREAASKARQDVTTQQPTASKPSKKKKKKALQRPTAGRESKSPAKNLSHLTDNPRRLLKAVIDIMKERHTTEIYEPLSFEQILLQIGCSTVSEDLKQTLLYDLKNNPKMEYNTTTETFQFKPALGLNVRNRKQLLRYLRECETEARGGTLLSEIKEAVHDPDTVMRKLDNSGDVYRITRQDKEEVVFYKNTQYELEEPLSEEFKAHWHRVSVEGMTDDDIEKYLTNCGIGAMGGEGRKRKAPGGEAKKAKKRARNTKILNVHLDDTVLKDYSSESK